MENASKALIIAAAVLIAILLISSAIFFITSSSEQLGSSGTTMTELQIYSFNNKFTKYEGEKQSGSQVLALLNTVASSNASNDNQVAVKLWGTGIGTRGVLDSCKFTICNDSNSVIRCHSGSHSLVSLDEITAVVKENKFNTYNVKLYYCNQTSASNSTNKNLKPAVGCVLLVDIGKNRN